MRIGVTTLDSFDLFQRFDWMTEEDLLTSIRGEAIPTERMMLGTAFGRAIADPGRYWDSKLFCFTVKVRGGDEWFSYRFRKDAVMDAAQLFDPRGSWETRGTLDFGGGLTIVGKADQLAGTEVVENKTKWAPPKMQLPREYKSRSGSFQWKFLLLMFGCRMATYRIFELSKNPIGLFELSGYFPFHQFAYPKMAEECRSIAEQFRAYVEGKPGLVDFLNEREQRTLKYVKSL